MPLSLDGTTGISASGNIVGNNISVSGTLTAASFSPTSVSASGNITGGNILSGGLISAVSIVTSAANISGNNITTSGLISATGSITSAANVVGGNITTAGIMSSTGNGIHGNILTAGLISATSNMLTAGYITATGNVLGNIFTVNLGNTTGAAIVNGGGNGVGNIGSATGYFNTIHAKATSAQYADLAELYQADKQLDAGHVVEFGGTHEIQKSTTSHSTKVAGVISTQPSYIMNATLDAPNVYAVALTGRVPCFVVGTIAKGDRLVASEFSGVATVLDMSKYEPGCIIGKALDNYDSQEIGRIEIAVGRF